MISGIFSSLNDSMILRCVGEVAEQVQVWSERSVVLEV